MVQPRAVIRFIGRNSKRVAISIVGGAVLAVGVVLSAPFVPGPGLLLVVVGLAILATEYAWARHALEKTRRQARRAAARMRRRRKRAGLADDAQEQDRTGT